MTGHAHETAVSGHSVEARRRARYRDAFAKVSRPRDTERPSREGRLADELVDPGRRSITDGLDAAPPFIGLTFEAWLAGESILSR
ncbi:MAG: hypothetical protein ABI083_03660 [Lapillicoccus sp.]